MKRFKILPVVMSGLLMLSGCGLLPEEETFRMAPVVKTYEKEEFEETVVVRGDIHLTKSVSFTYIPLQSEQLSFPVGGELYDEIFVQVGDSVKKGELLAQLDLSGAQESVDACTKQINKLKMQLSALEENRKLELDRQEILLGGSAEEVLKEALDRTNRQYDLQKQPLEDALTVANMQLREANALLSERQIRAGMDGTVTYVYDFEVGERNVEGEWVVTLADTSSSLFRGKTKYWSYFAPGEEYTVTVGSETFETVVISETDLGMEEIEKQEDEEYYVYLQLKNPVLEFEGEGYGTVTLSIDSRENVLLLPKSAVTKTKGNSIVYYQDENGLKAYKQVETGLSADGMIEIVSGLTEGERIILG